MAITSGVCNSFKTEILNGEHLPGHTYKVALFTSAANLGPSTTTYTGQSGEVANGNGYATGGLALSGRSVTLDGSTAVLDWTTDPEWTDASFTCRGALIYNDTLAGKNAVAVINFVTDKSPIAGTMTLVFPAPTSTEGLIRLGPCA